jgi:hypothetical protein
MSKKILDNKEGITISPGGYPVASLERAILDMYHLKHKYKVDRSKLSLINKNELLRLAKIYNNKAMMGRVVEFINRK